MNNPNPQPTELGQVEPRLASELKHTLKLVPQSQRELFITELARWYAKDSALAAQAARREELDNIKAYGSYGVDRAYSNEPFIVVPVSEVEERLAVLNGSPTPTVPEEKL